MKSHKPKRSSERPPRDGLPVPMMADQKGKDMTYTKHGLKISLEELRRILEHVENRAEYGNMEHCIYISGGDSPTIKQYCCYADCAPINHTYLAH